MSQPSRSRTERVLGFLRRIRCQVPRPEDYPVIEVIGPKLRKRHEQPLDRHRPTEDELFEYGASLHAVQDQKQGLRELGFKEVPVGSGPNIVPGAKASIHLVYNMYEEGRPLEQRHLAAAKVQEMNSKVDIESTYYEVEILKSVVHENIVYFYDCFTTSYKKYRSVWILLEYANAGDLEKEMDRYGGGNMPETGARYYATQIAHGLKYLHDKHIVHADLHARNVLLKYNRDGTKNCMITDFGLAEILPEEISLKDDWDKITIDVAYLCRLIIQMIGRMDSPEQETIRYMGSFLIFMNFRFVDDPKCPKSVDQLMKLRWFSGTRVAPIPKSPTPLLEAGVPESIGYQRQAHPTGAPAPVNKVIAGRHGETGRGTAGPSVGSRISQSLSRIGRVASAPFRRIAGRHRPAEPAVHYTSRARSPSPQPSSSTSSLRTSFDGF